MKRTAQSFWCAVSLFVFAATTCYSQENARADLKPYLVFEKTASPDGRYAIAWGLPKHPDVWAKVCEFDRKAAAGSELNDEDSQEGNQEVFQRVVDVAEDVENYVVDLREGKIVHKLQGRRGPESEPEYFVAANTRPNRHDLEVVWANTGRFVLINHTYRWDCVTFCALPVDDKHVGPELDLNKPLGDAVRRFVAKSLPAGSGYSKKDLNISFSDLKQSGDANFSTHSEAVIGKDWSSDGADVEFAISSVNDRLTLKIRAVHRSR
ncbi:MAG: hypothetical protein DMF06_02010 [Verrucomicrobia bacterium]|nr:MAG: hypothetical protein DMF06_02010 [Verrucomicrobiota bacterium]